MKMACLGLNKGKIEKKLNNDQANDILIYTTIITDEFLTSN